MIRRRDAAKIRKGIRTAQEVMNRKRMEPPMTPWYVRGEMVEIPLWERAYHYTISSAVRSGRLRPPRD